MELKTFSYELEKHYYSQQWPQEPTPFHHLEPYLRCWLDPDTVFTGKTVLDIGAGECTYTRLIADRFQPKGIVACELFRERMLPAARSNRAPNLAFVAGDALKLPFWDGSFDVVFAGGVLSQIPNLGSALSELKRVLKPQGLFIGWEPNPFNPVIAYRYFFKPHSANQYLFWPWLIRRAFEAEGFHLTMRYFYAKLPRVGNRFLGTCMGMYAGLKTKLSAND
jgi:ubiquinone/menaquinone biosynthesis C-methylase UbiE